MAAAQYSTWLLVVVDAKRCSLFYSFLGVHGANFWPAVLDQDPLPADKSIFAQANATFQVPGSAFPVPMSSGPDMCCWLDSLLGIAGLPELCHVLSVASCNISKLSLLQG